MEQDSLDGTQSPDHATLLESQENPRNDLSTQVTTGEKKSPAMEGQKVTGTAPPILDWFTRLLSLWILLCMILGTLTGVYAPDFASALAGASIAEVNIPIAILVWLMVFPMMLNVDLTSIKQVRDFAVPVGVTTTINYCVQPFAMYGFARLFFNVVFAPYLDAQEQEELIGGAVLLGAGPCTAMVFVWSLLVHGDPTYTLVQVAVNDIFLLFLFAPTVGALLETGTIVVPWLTIIMCTFLFILVPFVLALIARFFAGRSGNGKCLEDDMLSRTLTAVSRGALIITVYIIFVMQGQSMIGRTGLVFMILVPLTVQTVFVFVGALISTSNFFELSVAVAITTFGPESGAVLVNSCGVLEEVPLMVFLTWVCNKLEPRFIARAGTRKVDGKENSIFSGDITQTEPRVKHSNSKQDTMLHQA
eukprot:CAMPEP_0184508418 /NCGR_PEP_ID=MMETSP0198_2-20121128/750_1 /TAXON_ID=1112570 /ORGANISM="Thraustochytrium sp., Strain LLF1b" /LENGTH=417 /DNA_ID=CAMNT_0026898201 /DNA_START=583 /DNA_END=1836 /DNA_ORIENTATION=-